MEVLDSNHVYDCEGRAALRISSTHLLSTVIQEKVHAAARPSQ